MLSIASSLLFLPVPSAFLLSLSPSVSASCSKAGEWHGRKQGSLLGMRQFESCYLEEEQGFILLVLLWKMFCFAPDCSLLIAPVLSEQQVPLLRYHLMLKGL